MAGISTYLVLLAVIALGLATVVGISQPFGNRAVRLGEYVSWLGAGLLALAMVVYGVSAGRLPMGSMYEYSVALGFGGGWLGAGSRERTQPLDSTSIQRQYISS